MTDHTDDIPYVQAAIVQPVIVTPGFLFFDKLGTIFEGQRKLMDKYRVIERNNYSFPVEQSDEGDLDGRLVQARMHEMYGFLTRELGEAMQELRSKPWKQAWKTTDRDKFYEEMADALHFYVEMCITAGMTADDLFQWYFKAWEKNRGRQDGGYSDTQAASSVGEVAGLAGDSQPGHDAG